MNDECKWDELSSLYLRACLFSFYEIVWPRPYAKNGHSAKNQAYREGKYPEGDEDEDEDENEKFRHEQVNDENEDDEQINDEQFNDEQQQVE